MVPKNKQQLKAMSLILFKYYYYSDTGDTHPTMPINSVMPWSEKEKKNLLQSIVW